MNYYSGCNVHFRGKSSTCLFDFECVSMCDPHGSLLWSLCIEPADKAFYNRFFIPFLAGVAKKFLFEILELCLQICYDPVFFVIPDIAFLQHLLQRQDQIILGTDGCIQLWDRILQFLELDVLCTGCHGPSLLCFVTGFTRNRWKKRIRHGWEFVIITMDNQRGLQP